MSSEKVESTKPTKPTLISTRPRTPSDSSSSLSLKSPRTARFAEATAVYSPIEPSKEAKSPFADPPQMATEHKPSDVGFGYITNNDASRDAQLPNENNPSTPAPPLSPLKSPMKSALKIPGTPARKFDNPLSPTFKEEQVLEKEEKNTEKRQASDLVSILKFASFG
jgi:hypothetical protein